MLFRSVDCDNWFERFIYTFEDWKKSLQNDTDRYKQALEEIEKYCNNQIGLTGDLPFRTTESDILDIISRVKGEVQNENT